MLVLNQPEYQGIKKVISGGQCGADFGGLLAAEALGIPTGGFIPKGFRTHHGPRPELGSRFNLVETLDFGYKTRTVKNVKLADGTIIIATNLGSPGCVLTSNSCRAFNKPVLPIKLTPAMVESDMVNLIVEWLTSNLIETLNVAGNRDKIGNVHETMTVNLLMKSLALVPLNK